jgi:lysozyme
MSNVVRVVAAAATLSASFFVTTLVQEDFVGEAMIPVKGDRPTYGFGSTFKADGTPVKLGDRIKPTEAAVLAYSHASKDEAALRKCVTGKVSIPEWGLLLGHAYQYGVKTTCNSSMVKYINQGNYKEACLAYLNYKWIHKGKPNQYDCSTMVNGKRNKVCWGVWERSLQRSYKCMEGLQ